MAARKTHVGVRQPPRTASAVTRQLFEIMDQGIETNRSISKKLGRSFVSVSKWRHGKTDMSLIDFENMAQVLGYRLVLEPVEKD